MSSSIHIRPSEKGSLHRALGIKPNALIPASRLQSAIHGSPSPALKKKLVFAENARKWGKGVLIALSFALVQHYASPVRAQVFVAPACNAMSYPVGSTRPPTQNPAGAGCISGSISASLAVTPLTNTQTPGTVTTHGTFQAALAASGTRNGCLIQNTSADTEYIFFGATGSATTSNAFKLGASQSISCSVGGLGVATDNIAITSAVTDGATYVVTKE